jgi:SAM-dependent methyltransferase
MSYALPNAETAARARLAALAELFDATTFRHIEAIGIAPGWRCWEVGAGGSTVTRWLAERVGPSGRVVATDLDPSHVGGSAVIDVRVHDVAREPPPADQLDLVHARLVLVHVPERDAVLRTLVSALRPGGWLVIEDADPALQPLAVLDPRSEADELANRLRAAARAVLTGIDPAYGRTLPRRLAEAGLVDVSADAYMPLALPACTALERATIAQVGPRLLDRGLATADELERHLASLDAGLQVCLSPLVSAWGRRRTR